MAVLLISNLSTAQVVISQAYGGGGNTGATFTHDYVELLNTGTTSVSLNGMSIQYGSATGTSWSGITALPNVNLLPGQYFLIQQAQGTGGTTALPTPDLIPSAPIAMAGTNFKILLANTIDAQTGACPTGPQILDLVGFGTANCFEGTVAGALSNTTAGIRANNGCQDTNDNSSDFTAGTPNPRNTSSPVNICGTASANDNAIAGLKIYPNPNTGSTLYVTSDLIGDKSVVVFDVLGKQILTVSNVTENGINIGNLKAGIYMVKVSQDGKSATRKLVVQ